MRSIPCLDELDRSISGDIFTQCYRYPQSQSHDRIRGNPPHCVSGGPSDKRISVRPSFCVDVLRHLGQLSRRQLWRSMTERPPYCVLNYDRRGLTGSCQKAARAAAATLALPRGGSRTWHVSAMGGTYDGEPHVARWTRSRRGNCPHVA